MKSTASIVLGLLFISVAPVAHALDLGGVIHINSDVSGQSKTSVSGNADISASTSASSDAQTGSGSGTAGGNASAGANIGIDIAPAIVITRASAEASGSGSSTVSSPASVQSKSDLSAYASGVVRADTDVSNASLSAKAVSLAYRQPAKLFGFIPVYLQATATVNADGSTNVSYPWYAFLTTKDSATLESDVRVATKDTVSANADVNAGFSAATQAKLLAEMRDAMKARLQADTSVDANADASVK
jgi:hypothetical protein